MSRTQIGPSLVPASQNATNILINGGMEVWQRGTTFSSPATNTYTADRWKMNVNGAPTFTVSRDSTNVDNGTFSAKLDITVTAGSTGIALRQVIENIVFYNGKALTLTARVKCSVANKCVIALADDNGVVASSSNVGTGFETLTVSIPNVIATSTLNIYLGPVTGGGVTPAVSTIYFDSAMLVIGTAPAPFCPTNPEVEFAQCLRYYQKICGNVSAEGLATTCNDSTTVTRGVVRFPVVMRGTPTVTAVNPTLFNALNAAGGAIAITTIGFAWVSAQSCLATATVAAGLVAANASQIVSTSTTAFITADAEI